MLPYHRDVKEIYYKSQQRYIYIQLKIFTDGKTTDVRKWTEECKEIQDLRLKYSRDEHFKANFVTWYIVQANILLSSYAYQTQNIYKCVHHATF